MPLRDGPRHQGQSRSADKPGNSATPCSFSPSAAAAIGLALLLGGICVGTYLFDGSVFLWPLFVAPLLVLLGIAGLIDPNVVRATMTALAELRDPQERRRELALA